MNSHKATAQGRPDAGFNENKAGAGNILRVALSRSRLCLLLLLLTAPPAMAATAASCQDGANVVIDGTVTTVIHYDTGTYMYIDAPSWDCTLLYVLVKDAGTCDLHSTIHAEGTLSQPIFTNPYVGWSLSNTTAGDGTKYASSFSCK